MARLLSWTLVPALIGWLAAVQPLAAQNRTEFINDEAGLFSSQAKAKANAEIARMRAQTKKELVVDTVVTVKKPTEIDAKDTAAVNRFFDQWAQQRAAQQRVNGVYVVIVENPHKFRVEEGNKTKQQGFFTDADRKELEQLIIADMTAAQKDGLKNTAKNDKVLLTIADFVVNRISAHAPAAQSTRPAVAAPAAPHAPRAEGTPWLTYILIGVGVLLVLWIIMGVVRGLSGAGRGGMAGPGMAGPGMMGGGGGGGGGFFSSLLGGMFGAAAGMWMYNNVFGGHSNAAWGAGPDAGTGAAAGNDADTGYSGGGDDYGDAGNAGGGDAGGGGDVGGGGDWGGGGGGDWGGGGGGGDFGGGGGGGDFGGGGGDW